MRFAFLALVSMAAIGVAAPPDAPQPKPVPGIVFPVNPKQPVTPPSPQPTPGAVSKLAGDELYLVTSAEPFLLFASPEGLVKVTKAAGPVTLFAKFAGGGAAELRTVTDKHVAIVQATGKGRVELVAVPVGAADESKATRQTVDVDAGQGPQPPPKPDDPPAPKPDEPVKSFRVIFIYESGDTLTAAQNGVIYAKAVSDWLTANTTSEGKYSGWRRFDKDSAGADETAGMKALWQAVKPQVTSTPCVAIERNGKADIVPLPATPEDAIALFAKYKGAK